VHCRIRARVEHGLARLKDWQVLRQCRRRGDAINDNLHIIAALCNLKTHNQLRVNSQRRIRPVPGVRGRMINAATW
jgi:hypothetical protein